MDFPQVETRHLFLRGVVPEDRFAIFRNYSDPEVANWFFDQPLTRVEQADLVIRAFIQKSAASQGFTWAILLKEGGELIGTCGYENYIIGGRGEIGFDLARAYWGHGYMQEALEAVIAYGFQALELAAIEAHTYSHNLRSRRLLEKSGFRVEAVSADSHCYILPRTAWLATRLPQDKTGGKKSTDLME